MKQVPDTRRAVLIHGDGTASVGEAPMPELGPNEVVVKTAVSLISAGTETGGMRIRRQEPVETAPRMSGYAIAGTVVALGSEATGFEVGERVIGMAGECYPHADYNVGHPMMTVPIPDGVGFDDAVMVCLAATSMQAVRRLAPELGGYYAIVGQGLVGQFATQLATLAGGRIAAVDLDSRRLEVAVAHGAEIGVNPAEQDLTTTLMDWAEGEGIDGAMFAFGGRGDEVVPQIAQAFLKAPDGHQVGNMVFVGNVKTEIDLPIPFGNMDIKPSSRTGPGYHDLTYHMGRDYPRAYVRWSSRRNFVELLRRVADGSFHVSDLVTHRFPFEEAGDAYDVIVTGSEWNLGVLLEYE